MSRASCNVCLRPDKTCICHLFQNINNNVHVIVLQHTTEVKQTKGTVTLLAKSLKHCNVIVGEDFTKNEELNSLLQYYQQGIYLLYPSENAVVLSSINDQQFIQSKSLIEQPNNNARVKCIIVLDGTWKKAYKMYMLNNFLHNIPHLTLPESIQGDYKIRKTQKANALSSLEACTYALIMLESNTSKYQNLLASFTQFNNMQLSYIK